MMRRNEREAEDEREVDRESAYINKPREKTPKIILARERNKSGDITGMRAGAEGEAVFSPCRAATHTERERKRERHQRQGGA